MRFLILTQYFPPEVGAPQVRLMALARELQRLGHEVEVVTAQPNHPLGKIFPDYRNRLYSRDMVQGIMVHRTWVYPAVGSGLARLGNYFSFTLSSMIGLFKARRPDFLIVESPPLFLSVPAACYGWLRRVPFIFNVADLWPDSARELKVIGRGPVLCASEALERWSYRRATFVNAVTTGIERTLRERKRVPRRKLLFMPNGVDLELFRPRAPDATLARQLGVAGRPVLLYAGTLGIAQGLETALEAFAVLQRRNSPVALLLIGSGSSRQVLVERARAGGLVNVLFLDPQPLEYVARLYSFAAAGLVMLKDLPLFEGARPSKMFPIIASGKPVIYCGKGEGAELIRQARAGIVVPPEDPLALADAVERLLKDPDQASSFGTNGRSYAEQNIGWRSVISSWLEHLADQGR